MMSHYKRHKAEYREYNRLYREAHKEYFIQYHKDNVERIRQYKEKYKLKKKEEQETTKQTEQCIIVCFD